MPVRQLLRSIGLPIRNWVSITKAMLTGVIIVTDLAFVPWSALRICLTLLIEHLETRIVASKEQCLQRDRRRTLQCLDCVSAFLFQGGPACAVREAVSPNADHIASVPSVWNV